MKISCTRAEQIHLIGKLTNNNTCPFLKCNIYGFLKPCTECLLEDIEWEITDED